VNPKTQSLATLPDKYKEKIIKTIVTLTKQSNIIGAESLLSAVTNTDFNKVLHQQMQHFMQEFASRKNIEIPICLD
jgi:hypothetical protein